MHRRIVLRTGAACALALILGAGCDPVAPPEMPRLHLAFSYAGAESGTFEVVADRLPPLYGLMLLDGPIAYAELPPGGSMALHARDPDHAGRGAALTLHLGGGATPGVVPLLPVDPGPLSGPSILQLGPGAPASDIFRLIEGEAHIHRMENDWIEGTFQARLEHLDHPDRIVEVAGGAFSLPVLRLSL
jgi:hypothetical protein